VITASTRSCGTARASASRSDISTGTLPLVRASLSALWPVWEFR
jgi:hypothetical protein